MNESGQTNERYLAFLEEVKGFQALLDQLKKSRNLDELSNKLPLVDYAQLNASLAYCLNTVSKMYKSLNGAPFENNKDENDEKIKGYFTKIQEVILTESEQKDNPFAERKENTERMIKDILFEKIYPEELQPLVLDNILENKGNLNIEKIKSPKNLGDQENQPENLLQEKVPEQTNQKKNKKKNQKGVLVSNENKPSWRDELDKMLK